MERRIEFSLRELFTTNERTNERTNKRTNERTNERRQSGSDAVSGNIVVRVLEQCRDRTVPRARTQRKEGSIRALVWSYCSRALSSDQGMNIERSNPAWPELFRPSPPSRRVLVSPLPSSPPLSLSLSLSLSSGVLSRGRGTATLFYRVDQIAQSRQYAPLHPLS